MKNKGFTLIELLAVIVILAIIALIAIPQITNVIEEARKSAAESSTLGYMDAVEKYIMLHDVDSNKYPYDLRGKTLNVAKNTEISLLDIFVSRVYAESAIPSLNKIVNPKGKKPTSGTIVVNEKGKVSNYAVIINGYKVKPKKDANDNLIVEKPVARKMGAIIVSYHANGGTGEMADTKDIVATNAFTAPEGKVFKEWNTKSDGTGEVYTSETPLEDDIDLYAIWEDRKPEKVAAQQGETHKGIVYMDPTNLKRECNASNSVSTTGTKTGCMKFYIFKETDDKYFMILDHNTSSLKVEYADAASELQKLVTVSGWQVTPRHITAFEVAAATENSGTYHTKLPDMPLNKTAVSSGQVSKYHWIYDNLYRCQSYGCKVQDDNSSNSSYGYWTSTWYGEPTANSYQEMEYYVSNSGYLTYKWRFTTGGSGVNEGIRPVIEVPKSSING